MEQGMITRHSKFAIFMHWFNAVCWLFLLVTGLGLIDNAALSPVSTAWSPMMKELFNGGGNLLAAHITIGVAWSVMFLISSGNSAISAIPPALSVIGPYASRATMMPVMDNIDVAAIAIPYNPAKSCDAQILAQITITGAAVDFIETPRPAITLVPSPVKDDSAMVLTGA